MMSSYFQKPGLTLVNAPVNKYHVFFYACAYYVKRVFTSFFVRKLEIMSGKI